MEAMARRLHLLAAEMDPGDLRDLRQRLPQAVVDATFDLLAELPPPARGHLLQVSMQRTVTHASAAAHMVRDGDAGAGLADLVAAGLLRPADGRGAAWEVLPLLHRAVLQRLHETDPPAARRTHEAIVLALLEAEEPDLDEDLLFHARLAGRWDVLARMWTRTGLSLALSHPELTGWAYRAPPPAALRRYPSLQLAELVAEASELGTEGYANERLLHVVADDAETALAGLGVAADAEAVLASGTLTMIALRHTGDVTAANRVVDVVTDELAGRAEATHAQGWVLFCLESALSRWLSGRLLDVRHYARVAADEADAGPGGAQVRAQAIGLLALANSVLGWADPAHQAVTADATVAGTLPGRIARAHLAVDEIDLASLDRLVDSLGDPEGPSDLWPFIVVARSLRALLSGDALRLIPELDRVASFRRSWLTDDGLPSRLLRRCRTELLLAGGDVQRAAAILRSSGPLPPELRVPLARLHLQTGDFAEADRFTAAILDDPRPA